MIAKTLNKICRGLKSVNWVNIQDRWNLLKGIALPRVTKGNRIDLHLGADHSGLMYSMKEVTGAPNELARNSAPQDGLQLERFSWARGVIITLASTINTFRLQVDTREPTFTLPEKDTTERNCFPKCF